MPTSEFSLLIQDVVMKRPENLKKVARYSGKCCSTLIREADPYDIRAKLGADTLLAIMEVCQDVRPLVFMAKQMGLELHRETGGVSDE